MLKGIDVSHWQRGLNLNKIDFDFVIVKATEGVKMVDKKCDPFIQEAIKLGKCFGFYHFARPEKNSAHDEAQFFYRNTRNYFGHGIPVLDWESVGKYNVKWAKAWLDEIYALTGVRPIIYMSESVVNQYNWSEVAGANYGLWVAKYRDNIIDKNYDMTYAGKKPVVKWWKFYALWQWTSSGLLDGYNGKLDCDVFYGSVDAWKKYAGII